MGKPAENNPPVHGPMRTSPLKFFFFSFLGKEEFKAMSTFSNGLYENFYLGFQPLFQHHRTALKFCYGTLSRVICVPSISK